MGTPKAYLIFIEGEKISIQDSRVAHRRAHPYTHAILMEI
jgi:hypothetical protein